MTRKRVLALLQDHGDLAGIDVRELDLSSDAIEREYEALKRNHRARPNWFSEVTGGINFVDATLAGAQFDSGKVWRGDFARSNLHHTSFQFCDAGVCRFAEADLTAADFTGATLARANFRGSLLCRTRFSDADVTDVDFTGSTFDHVYLAGATLVNTRIERQQLSNAVGEELDGDYRSAVSAYAGLKSNFRNLGLFEDASWAYMRERRMETKALAPWRRNENLARRAASALRWLGGCLSGLVVGYGERPLRAATCVPFLVTAYALFYWRLGDLTVNGKTAAGLGACFRQSLASLVTLSTTGAQAARPFSPGAQIWMSLEALTGVSLIALVMFSLGKRITRS